MIKAKVSIIKYLQEILFAWERSNMNKKKFFSVVSLTAILFIFLPLQASQAFPDNISEKITENTFFLPMVENHLVDGSNMVHIPEGYSWFGCDPDHNGGIPCDYDYLERRYTAEFYIDKTEVTNAQYARCVADGICRPPLDFSSKTRKNYYINPRFSDFPVVHVTYYDADTYCIWAGKQIPLSDLWEKAARGPDDTRAYPWGDEDPNCTLANSFNDLTSGYCLGDTARVGSYPAGASPYGVLDMAGNVAEIEPYVSWMAQYYRNGSFDSHWSKLIIIAETGWDQLSHPEHLPTVGFRCSYIPCYSCFPDSLESGSND